MSWGKPGEENMLWNRWRLWELGCHGGKKGCVSAATGFLRLSFHGYKQRAKILCILQTLLRSGWSHALNHLQRTFWSCYAEFCFRRDKWTLVQWAQSQRKEISQALTCLIDTANPRTLGANMGEMCTCKKWTIIHCPQLIIFTMLLFYSGPWNINV